MSIPSPDLAAEPDLATRLVAAASARLMTTIAGLDDATAAEASRLPGWTIGHLLTHLARNADGHRRRVLGALEGVDVPKYPGGSRQRVAEIDNGARRAASVLVADVHDSELALQDAFARASAAGWPTIEATQEAYPTSASPAHRLRELEMHHLDLGLGYSPTDWSPEYTAWDLDNLLATVPSRIAGAAERGAWVAWLSGRGPLPTADLAPWG